MHFVLEMRNCLYYKMMDFVFQNDGICIRITKRSGTGRNVHRNLVLDPLFSVDL